MGVISGGGGDRGTLRTYDKCKTCNDHNENHAYPKIRPYKYDINMIMSKYDKMCFNPVRYALKILYKMIQKKYIKRI